MKRVNQKSRNAEVARTGKIPPGSELRHRHLRNPSVAHLRDTIRETEKLIPAGECQAEWGRKRIEALEGMLEAKQRSREERRGGNTGDR